MKTATLGEVNLLRIDSILGNQKKGIAPLIPIGKTAWYAGIKSGRFPKPVKVGARAVAWRAADIRALIERQPEQAAAA